MFVIYQYLAMPLLVPPPSVVPVLITSWLSPTPMPLARGLRESQARNQSGGFAAIDVPVMAWNNPMPGPAIFSR